MPEVPTSEVFIGRESELEQMGRLVDRVRSGEPWLVTIEGEAGVGKSALASRVLSLVADRTVLSARSDPVESDIRYGVLQQLLRRVEPALLGQLPLLTGGMESASPFAIGAQMLSIIGELQSARPVAVLIDDLQWCDQASLEALTFAFRRLSVDSVLVELTVRGDSDLLAPSFRRLLNSVERRQRIRMEGLALDEVGTLATALGVDSLDANEVGAIHRTTGGHPLYLRALLAEIQVNPASSDRSNFFPSSLTAVIRDQLALLPPDTRAVVEMLSVLNLQLPIVQLHDAAGIETAAAAAIEPAVTAGLVDWLPDQPTGPVVLRHSLIREAIYVGMTPTRRRDLHARAVAFVDRSASWIHRVAALDESDEELAGDLDREASADAASGRLTVAARHLLWAADVSAVREARERRQLTAVSHLMLVDEARGLEMRPLVESARPSALRGCVLGTMAFMTGKLGEAEARLIEALDQVDAAGDQAELTGLIANRLSGTYTLLGQGAKVVAFGRRALETGTLDAAAVSQTRTLIAIGMSQVKGPRAGLAELDHLDPNPNRIESIHADGLAFRGVFHLLSGSLPEAVEDLATSVRMLRRGATFTLGLRAYVYLALAQYLRGAWDDVLLTAEQGFAEAAIRSRAFERPMLHLAAGCVSAGRGAARDAEQHAACAERVAASLDYGQERLYASMARALLHQATGDYEAMADTMSGWVDETELDGRTRAYGVLWRPLVLEGLIGSGRVAEARVAFEALEAQGRDVEWLRGGLAWMEGWLAEQEGAPERAKALYEQGASDDVGASPVYSARLALAHGRLLRRLGNRKEAVARLRHANALFGRLRAAPFLAWTETELIACGLHTEPATEKGLLELTSRETEVAHLVGQGLSNAEVAAELFVSRKAVEYHLGNIYAKLGLRGRQELRRFVANWRQPAVA